MTSSVSVRGTQAAEWDKNTWAPLEDLARNHPEAGVHFQGRTGKLLMGMLLTKSQTVKYIIAPRTLALQQLNGLLNYYHRILGSKTSFPT